MRYLALVGLLLASSVHAATMGLVCPSSVRLGDPFTVELQADVGQSALGAYSTQIVYDPSQASAESVLGGFSAFFATPPANSSPGPGSVNLSGFQAISLTQPTGVVSIARVVFTALGSSATISYGSGALFNTDSVSIPVSGLTGCTVAIEGPTTTSSSTTSSTSTSSTVTTSTTTSSTSSTTTSTSTILSTSTTTSTSTSSTSTSTSTTTVTTTTTITTSTTVTTTTSTTTITTTLPTTSTTARSTTSTTVFVPGTTSTSTTLPADCNPNTCRTLIDACEGEAGCAQLKPPARPLCRRSCRRVVLNICRQDPSVCTDAATSPEPSFLQLFFSMMYRS